VTPEEQYRLLRGKSAEIDAAVEKAFEELMRRIRAGEDPRDAVAAAMDSFSGEYAEILAAGLAVTMAESVGTASVMDRPIGPINLSRRMYAEAEATSAVVRSVVQDHARGFQDTRELALDLFEGYEFRETEVLRLAKNNPELPKYMRQALLDDPGVTSGLRRAFARLQVEGLRTPELRTAYRDVLEAIDAVELGAGDAHLERKLRTAFYERMRYFAKRIAETELHREFSARTALEILSDADVKYVQWRLSPMHPVEDICDYFAGVDLYGLGPGVYPKELAPVAPAHPHCKCVLSPRLDLNDREISPRDDADSRFFSARSLKAQRLIAGSKDKLDRIKRGTSAWEVHNARIDPEYRVKRAKDIRG
jgi:hypothetical protein